MTVSPAYDLLDRTRCFAIRVRSFVSSVPRMIGNIEDCKQLVRSSGSVGANYIEANECVSKKDRIFRMKICKKEAKESAYWLCLLHIPETEKELEKERQALISEADQLERIFAAIIRKLL